MKELINKIIHPKKTKWHWLYTISGIVLLLLGVMLMPVWDKSQEWVFWKNWGNQFINIIIAALLVMYLLFYLIKKIRKSSGTVQMLCVIEFVLLAVIAAGSVLQHLQIITIQGGSCAILGIALWCRGVVEIFRAYYHRHGNNDSYPVWWLVIAILLVSFGVYLFVKPTIFTNIQLLWFFVILLLLISIILILDGFIAKPKGKKGKKEANSDKENE